MRWHLIFSWVCVASGCKASICQGPPVANLPLHTRNWSHSPPTWIIHYSHTQTLAHTELYLVRGKWPVLQDKQEGLLKCEVAVWLSLSHCTSLLLFDNSHLLLLLCAVQMTKWGNGLCKIIINAAGPLTRKEHFLLCSQEKEHPFKPCTIHCALYSLHALLYNCLDF